MRQKAEIPGTLQNTFFSCAYDISESQVFTVHSLIDYGNEFPIQLNRCLHLSDSYALKQGTIIYDKTDAKINISEGEFQDWR